MAARRRKSVVRKSKLMNGGRQRPLGRPRRGEADVHVNCRYPRALHRRFRMICVRRGLVPSLALRGALVAWVDAHA